MIAATQLTDSGMQLGKKRSCKKLFARSSSRGSGRIFPPAQVSEPSVKRLAQLVLRARERLKPLAKLTTLGGPSDKKASAVLRDLGDVEGLGCCIQIARVTLSSDGLVERAVHDAFMYEASEMLDAVQTSVMNSAVVVALILTVLVPLAVMDGDYPILGVGGDDNGKPEQLGEGFGNWTSAEPNPRVVWGDAAAFIAPGSREAQFRCRLGLYFAECACLAVGIAMCTIGLGVASMIHRAMSVMPSTISKLELLVDQRSQLALLALAWRGALQATQFSVIFVAAHRSAFMFFVMFGSHMAYNFYFMIFVQGDGPFNVCCDSYIKRFGVLQVARDKLLQEAKDTLVATGTVPAADVRAAAGQAKDVQSRESGRSDVAPSARRSRMSPPSSGASA